MRSVLDVLATLALRYPTASLAALWALAMAVGLLIGYAMGVWRTWRYVARLHRRVGKAPLQRLDS